MRLLQVRTRSRAAERIAGAPRAPCAAARVRLSGSAGGAQAALRVAAARQPPLPTPPRQERALYAARHRKQMSAAARPRGARSNLKSGSRGKLKILVLTCTIVQYIIALSFKLRTQTRTEQ